MGTVLHVTVDDDVVRRIDAVAAAKATSRSAIVRTMIAGGSGIAAGLEEYERTPELATCAYLPEGRFTVLLREYGTHNPRPDEVSANPAQDVEAVIATVLMSMYLRYGARYQEGSAVKRIRDQKRQDDLAAGHDSPVPF
jgi:Ribbon-helix-helix protein, copG family